MSNYEPMPLTIEDLENFSNLFHATVEGIETHLTHDRLNPSYVVSILLSLTQQLDHIVYDVAKESRQTARELAIRMAEGKTA